MLNNFRNLNSLYQSLGPRWLVFRLAYALRMRTGLIRRQLPAYQWSDRPLATWLKQGVPSQPEAYARWRRQHSPQFFFEPLADGRRAEAQVSGELPWDPELAAAEAERILNGELKYFAHDFIRTGFPPDWHTDPVSGKKVDPGRHWSDISNEGEVDIKFIWEASRFSMVYPLVRAYAFTRDPRLVEAFWELVQSWAESNPPNTGPNWMDGQEAALRLMAWTFGFYAFLDSSATTPEKIAQFISMIAAHAERIYKNIGYAISTHSNHTISEAFGLWLAGLLFPELRDARTYLRLGRHLLEQEAEAQIFPDGGYSMYALNYHRFILHIYLCTIRLAELNQSPLSGPLRQRVSASLDYLSQLIDYDSGQMPFYGSNDGALVLPLNNCDFTDFRPLLQLGSYLTRRQFLFNPGPWDEDLFWLCGKEFAMGPAKRTLNRSDLRGPGSSFPDAGTYILRGAAGKAILRCTSFRSRPSHADQLHVDVWWQGQNIACDAGTYLYSGKGIWRNGLAHTSVHNTVTVDGQDQMKMVSRFTWTDWAQGKVLRQAEKVWQGAHRGYRRLPDPVDHTRTVLSLGEDRWLVVDRLHGKRPHHYALHWLLSDVKYEMRELASDHFRVALDILDGKSVTRIALHMGLVPGNGDFSLVRADPHSTRGWRSRYYGQKEPALSLLLETHQPHVIFWSLFGFEKDSAVSAGDRLSLNFAGREITLNLQSPVSSL